MRGGLPGGGMGGFGIDRYITLKPGVKGRRTIATVDSCFDLIGSRQHGLPYRLPLRTILNNQTKFLLRSTKIQKAYLLFLHDHNCTKNSRHFLFLHFSTQSFSFCPIIPAPRTTHAHWPQLRRLPSGLLCGLPYGLQPRTTLNKQPNLRLRGKETQEAYLLHLYDHNCRAVSLFRCCGLAMIFLRDSLCLSAVLPYG